MELTKIKKEEIVGINLEYILLSLLYLFSFLVPLIITKPQLLVGSAVNFIIVYTTLKYGFKKSIPVLLIPSLVATGRGLLFGSSTIFLVYLLPFIMVSNGILAFTISRKKSWINILAGCILKSLFLFLVVNILINTVGLPQIFLTSMGYIQLVTAMIGGGVAFLIFEHIDNR